MPFILDRVRREDMDMTADWLSFGLFCRHTHKIGEKHMDSRLVGLKFCKSSKGLRRRGGGGRGGEGGEMFGLSNNEKFF